MKKIGIISDTHGYFDDILREFLKDVDEIWHAGDIGNTETADTIAAFKPLRAVYGNIDEGVLRRMFREYECFKTEGVTVLMTHIGGYPGKYLPAALRRIESVKPDIFIAGHSHILKVMHDKYHNVLHINPGAAGKSGFHKFRTAVRFEINEDRIMNLEVGEWLKQ